MPVLPGLPGVPTVPTVATAYRGVVISAVINVVAPCVRAASATAAGDQQRPGAVGDRGGAAATAAGYYVGSSDNASDGRAAAAVTARTILAAGPGDVEGQGCDARQRHGSGHLGACATRRGVLGGRHEGAGHTGRVCA